MLITFDLDDTLICWQHEVPTELVHLPWYYCWFTPEPLRKGTVEIFQKLRNAGWGIGIYTTSHRHPKYIRRLFRLHGLELDLIINQDSHEKIVHHLKTKKKPSKLPSKVGSFLHVDNSAGVFMEGQKFHFRVLVIDPLDSDWTSTVWHKAEQVAKMVDSTKD